jgi:hypothetical protein
VAPSIKLVTPEPPPEPKVDREKIEVIIQQFLILSWPERRAFVTRLRQVYRDTA